VLENVDVGPACEVRRARVGRKVEGGRGQLGAALALQKGIELGLSRVQIEHGGGGIGELLLAQAIGAPVEVCCCLERSTPKSSLHRSFRPNRSVNVLVKRAAILVQ